MFLQSMKKILRAIFRPLRGRIGKQHAWMNVISACLFTDLDSSSITPAKIGKMVNLSYGKIKHYSSKSLEKACLIHSGDNTGHELIEAD